MPHLSRRPFRTSPPKTSWEGVAGWYQEYMGQEGGDLQRRVVFPNALRLLDPQKNKTYLDLACGQGVFATLIAKTSLHVTGIDAAPSLIQAAKRQPKNQATFLVGDARSFATQFEPTSFDGVSCLLAIQNIDPIEPVFRDVANILKTHGAFVLVMNHPCFRQPRQSGWGWDEQRKMQYRRIDRYLSSYEMPIITHPGKTERVKTYSYHRPLQTYISLLAKHGLMVDAIEEWVSHKTSDSGPRAKAENVARAEFPLFLAIRARKILQ